ncbi:MAG: hypothetical protein V4857_19535 [Pseudomonadota bacterium]
MNDQSRQTILALSRQAHDLTETSYQADPAVKGDPAWAEKQRMLLADMSLHLLQTALREGELDTARLQTNLFSILKISAAFLPEKSLALYADAMIKP